MSWTDLSVLKCMQFPCHIGKSHFKFTEWTNESCFHHKIAACLYNVIILLETNTHIHRQLLLSPQMTVYHSQCVIMYFCTCMDMSMIITSVQTRNCTMNTVWIRFTLRLQLTWRVTLVRTYRFSLCIYIFATVGQTGDRLIQYFITLALLGEQCKIHIWIEYIAVFSL